MKKKIINGILMAAFLFAGTTSFVSCKDNVDDELVPVWNDLTTLKGNLSTLEGRVNTLGNTVAAHTDSINNLRTAVNKLRQDLTDLDGKVDRKSAELMDTLNARYNRLVTRVEKCENYVANLTVGVVIQGTADPVLGEVRGLLLNKNTLLGFVGKNDSQVEEFPVAGDDYNVKGFTTKLTADEVDDENIYELSGVKGEWLMSNNTFGRVYVSLNPLGADATKCSFYLVPTGAFFKDGEFSKTAPIQFAGVYPATKDITLALGKKSGMNWAEFLETAEWNPETDGYPVTWALDAFVDSTDFAGFKFDWTTFNSDYAQGWKMSNLVSSIRDIWNYVKNPANGTKTQRVGEAIKQSQLLMKLVADAINDKYASLPQYAIGTVVNDTKRGIVSEAKITSAAIEPIGYNMAVQFDAVAKKVDWDLSALKSVANTIVSKVQAKLPDFPASVTLVPAAGTTVNVVAANAYPAAGIAVGDVIATVDVSTVATQFNLATVQDLVNDALAFYKRIKNYNGNLVQRAEDYLNRGTDKLLDYYQNQVATVSVQPLVTMETNKGWAKLIDGLNTNTQPGQFDFVVTSLTGEYLVPVFMKYVALEVDGKITDSITCAGSQKQFQFDLPEGKSTLIVQCMDYTGHVITQKYPINAVEAE